MHNYIMDITPKNLELYLNINGWRKQEHKNDNIFVYSKYFSEYSKDYKLVFPKDYTYEDYYDKINNVINTISVLEKNDKHTLIQNILNTNRDILSFRVISEYAKSGSIPLELATKLVNGIKELLVASVCNEINPMPFIRRMTKDSIEYANEFRFAQTQKGSFIVNIETHDVFETGLQIDFDNSYDVPMTRRAMERIQTGLKFITEELNLEVLQNKSYKIGFNANMCDAVLDISEYESMIEIESKVKWANYFPQKKQIPEKISLKSKDFNVIKSLSDYYRNEENYIDVDLIGVISTLNKKWHDYKENRVKDRVVTIVWNNEGEIHYVKTQLGEEDYKRACNAHRDGTLVSISGTLDKSRNRWYLENAHNFKCYS